LLAVLFVAGSSSAFAQGTKLWTQSRFEEFEKGTPQGVEITSDGKLRNGPNASELITTPSSFVWSVAAGKIVNGAGPVFLATGAPAGVQRVDLDGKGSPRLTTVFESKALAVQVVRLGPDGVLYAATIPDGKVYRIKADATAAIDEANAEVVFDLAEADSGAAEADKAVAKKTEGRARYIWDMAFDAAGRLYIATGGPAAIYRIDVKQGKPAAELFFKSDEQHIRALAWDRNRKDGTANLIAGTDGSGLVYRIDPNGKGYVLFSAPRREITAVAVGDDGTVYAADVGDRNRNPLPQLPVQTGNAGITISFVQPGSVQAANASTALPEGTEVYALTANAGPRKLWSDKDDVVYQLAMAPGGLMALTGNRGRIFVIHEDGNYSDVAHLEAQQAVSLAALPGEGFDGPNSPNVPRGWLVGSANTGKLFRLKFPVTAGSFAYASDVLDAGAASRWGKMEVDPESRGYKFWTRSGNVEQPVRRDKDWGWTDWQPVTDGRVASPVGRYLQWKVELNEDGMVSGVGVNYLTVNSAPAVDDVLVVPGARVSPQSQPGGQPPTVSIAFPNPTQTGGAGFDPNASNATAPIQGQKDRTAVTVRWNAHDDNGDELIYDLYLRGDGERVWRPLKKGVTEKVFSFDGASFPDGGYQVKVTASDRPSHAPADALTGEQVSDRFEIDTTAPVISGLKAGAPVAIECVKAPCPRETNIPVNFDAKDAMSPISKAEYSLDAGPWQYIEPVGGLSDSKEEHYSVSVPLPAGPEGGGDEVEHLITVRAYDRHDNMATAKTLVPAARQP